MFFLAMIYPFKSNYNLVCSEQEEVPESLSIAVISEYKFFLTLFSAQASDYHLIILAITKPSVWAAKCELIT